MPEEETTIVPPVEPQAGETEKSSQPRAGENTTPEPQAGDGTETEPMSIGEAKKLRTEARNLRKRLEEAETLKAEIAELKQFKEATELEKASETEKQQIARQKLEKQLAEAQAELGRKTTEIQEQKINNDILAKASKVGINAGLAAKVLDHAEIDYDDKGNPTNIEELLKDLLKEYPNLSAQQAQQRQVSQSTAGGATNPGRSATSVPVEITQEFYDNLVKTGGYGKLQPEERMRIQNWLAKSRR